ncbi:MAG: RNA 2',3'-cyclic phosphodiesterase [Pseudomonadota bacterium]
MPRLFVGFPVADQTVEAIVGLQSGLENARWVAPNDFHVTLRFIGNVDGDVAADIDEALAEITASPVSIQPSGLGAFGKDKPRSVHAMVAHDPALMTLRSRIERAIQESGLAPERRKFQPHITVARLGRTPAPSVTEWLSDRGGDALPGYTAHTIALYSANSSRGGGPYRIEATVPLIGG